MIAGTPSASRWPPTPRRAARRSRRRRPGRRYRRRGARRRDRCRAPTLTRASAATRRALPRGSEGRIGERFSAGLERLVASGISVAAEALDDIAGSLGIDQRRPPPTTPPPPDDDDGDADAAAPSAAPADAADATAATPPTAAVAEAPATEGARPAKGVIERLFSRLAPSTAADEWRRLMGAGDDAPAPALELDARTRRLIARGVPPQWRGRVWHALLCRAASRRGDPALLAALHDSGYYALLLRRRARATHAEVRELIRKDARRTFGDHRDARKLQASTRRVLDAYSHRNPRVGYCQSMNFLAATLLLFLPEHAAFWTLCAIVELALPAGFYATQLHGVTVELRLLSDLLSRSHGALLAHLQRAGVGFEMACSRWLMCAFITVLPLAHTLRLWDLLLLDAAAKGGTSTVPLLVCLGLLQLSESKLLATSDADALRMLLLELPQSLSPSQLDELVDSVARVVERASTGADLLQEQVAPLRARHTRVVEAELLLREAADNPQTGSPTRTDAEADAEQDSVATSPDSGQPHTSVGVPAASLDGGAAISAASPRRPAPQPSLARELEALRAAMAIETRGAISGLSLFQRG